MPNYQYQCKLCDFSCTQAYMVNHLINKHPESFKTQHLLEASTTKVTPVKNTTAVKFGDYTSYSVYCCFGCKKFYGTDDKCGTHLRNSEDCKSKHQQRIKDMLAERTTAVPTDVTTGSGINPSVLQKAIADAVKEATDKQNLEIQKLTKEKLKLEQAIRREKEEVERLQEASEMADKLDDLKYENEELKLYRYKFERLRYILLFGLERNPYNYDGEPVPFLDIEKRRKLISKLESGGLLPKHTDTSEDNWYDDFQFDNVEPKEYKFPIEYEKEPSDDNDE